jgi:hypothetical protein
MSVSTLTSQVTYAGNASTSAAYPTTFPFFDATDLSVVVSTGTIATKLLNGTDYTVSGGSGATGSITTTSAIPNTSTVVIARNTAKTQLTSYTTGDRFPASAQEKALDKLTLMVQEATANNLPSSSEATGAAPFVLQAGSAGANPAWVPQSSGGIAPGAITNTMLAGNITPAKLSTGGPSWDTSGNFVAGGGLNPNIGAFPNGANGIGSFSSYAKDAINAIVGQLQMYSSVGGAVLNQVFNLPMLFFTNNTERMRIDQSGNVGIGTSSPTTKFHVNGGALNVTNAGDSVAFIQNTGGGNIARLHLINQNTGGRSFALSGWGAAQGGALFLSDETAAANRLVIFANGTIDTQSNPITNCPTTARAWVNFNGTAGSGAWAGGASTVTRSAGSTTATVTTTNPHGLTTGQTVYAASGVVAGTYVVTVLTTTTFTITTVATTALSAAAITFNVSAIRSSYNVSSVTKLGVGDYQIGFQTPMADANYCSASGQGVYLASTGSHLIVTPISTSAVSVKTYQNVTLFDSSSINITIFGN